MTWNISNVKSVQLLDFRINLKTIRDTIIKQNGIIELSDLKVSNSTLVFCDTVEMEGKLEKEFFTPTELYLTGDWSGTIWRDILLPSFKESIGSLSLILIWEDGEEIERVKIKDGNVKVEEINLNNFMSLINIKDQQPAIGQRCNVYDIIDRIWCYAYWERDSKFRLYNEGVGRIIRVRCWLPELPKPE